MIDNLKFDDFLLQQTQVERARPLAVANKPRPISSASFSPSNIRGNGAVVHPLLPAERGLEAFLHNSPAEPGKPSMGRFPGPQ